MDPATRETRGVLAAVEKDQAEIKARGTIAHVMNEKPDPAAAFVLMRGDYDKPKDKVDASTPAVLPPFPADFPRNRLGFAKWLLLPGNTRSPRG